MLNNSPRAAIATALLMLFSSHTGAYDKQSAMDAAKEEAAKLSIKDILTESSASGTVPEYGSDVSELKDLFAKGQGNLLTPGTSKADGCLSQTSMDCRAVQVIYDTHSRPGWEESDFDNILADRDHLLNKVPDLPSNGEEICETITTTRPPQTDFAVCEETTVGPALKAGQKSSTSQRSSNVLLERVRNSPLSVSPITTKRAKTTRVSIHRLRPATSEKKSKSKVRINTAVKLSSLNKTLIDAIDIWKWSDTQDAKSASSLRLSPRLRLRSVKMPATAETSSSLNINALMI